MTSDLKVLLITVSLFQCKLKVIIWWLKSTKLHHQQKWRCRCFPPLFPLLAASSHYLHCNHNRIGDKVQPWQSPTPTDDASAEQNKQTKKKQRLMGILSQNGKYKVAQPEASVETLSSCPCSTKRYQLEILQIIWLDLLWWQSIPLISPAFQILKP